MEKIYKNTSYKKGGGVREGGGHYTQRAVARARVLINQRFQNGAIRENMKACLGIL
jgi:hypothetical protein